jgi:hypothetical protein
LASFKSQANPFSSSLSLIKSFLKSPASNVAHCPETTSMNIKMDPPLQASSSKIRQKEVGEMLISILANELTPTAESQAAMNRSFPVH